MMAGASMELFRLTFDLISKYLNISVTFHTLIAWPGSCRLYFLSDIVSLFSNNGPVMIYRPGNYCLKNFVSEKIVFYCLLLKLMTSFTIDFWTIWPPVFYIYGKIKLQGLSELVDAAQAL